MTAKAAVTATSFLTLDLPDLLTADKSRRETLVQNLRQQLQEIRQSLHCRLPVYVVLTRLDLLTGFAALFHSLDKKDRDAILDGYHKMVWNEIERMKRA